MKKSPAESPQTILLEAKKATPQLERLKGAKKTPCIPLRVQ